MKRNDAELISRSLDGRLSPAERAKAERLLAADPQAASAARAWQSIGDQLRMDAARVAPPDPVLAWDDIRRQIRNAQPETSPSFSGLPFRWAAGLASVLLIGIASWLYFKAEVSPVAGSTASSEAVSRVEWVVAEVPGATTMIYTDAETDMTIIWMDLAQNSDARDS